MSVDKNTPGDSDIALLNIFLNRHYDIIGNVIKITDLLHPLLKKLCQYLKNYSNSLALIAR